MQTAEVVLSVLRDRGRKYIHAIPVANRWKAQCGKSRTLSLEGGCPEKARFHPL
jgi:hypothetical protein